jgi:pilus assembly protein Flp/PilA
MSRLKQWLNKLLRREDGPTSVEYAVMLALIIVACVTTVNFVGQKGKQTFSVVARAVEDGPGGKPVPSPDPVVE